MKELELIKDNVLSSQALVSKLEDTPKIIEIEVYFEPRSQTIESMFSDTVHFTYTTSGLLPTEKLTIAGQKLLTHLKKEFCGKGIDKVIEFVSCIKIETPIAEIQSADTAYIETTWSARRTFIPSEIENDFKYHHYITEFFMDGVNIMIKFHFNKESYENVRTRETLLRMNYLPIRLVKRRVK